MATKYTSEDMRRAYDTIAVSYTEWVETASPTRSNYLNRLLQSLKPSSRVVEIGCGAGVPITEILVRHPMIEQVIANDISSAQITLAKHRLRDHENVQFIEGDMRSLTFQPETIDGVAALFSLFHIPRVEQYTFLRHVYEWLKPGSMLVANFATQDNAEIKGEFFGVGMFWSGWGVDGTKKMLRDTGFEVVEADVIVEGGLKEGEPDYGIGFLWVVARKPMRAT
jgi:ubiquinone/menaquinone biosynthesis C-methylase UbiE